MGSQDEQESLFANFWCYLISVHGKVENNPRSVKSKDNKVFLLRISSDTFYGLDYQMFIQHLHEPLLNEAFPHHEM
jgi:hypothetical protein